LAWRFFIAATAPASAAPELTADEIVAKSQAAMAPPIHSRMVMGGVDAVVSFSTGGHRILGFSSRTENPLEDT